VSEAVKVLCYCLYCFKKSVEHVCRISPSYTPSYKH